MKCILGSTVITGLALAVGLSVNPAETLAATAAPVMSVVNTKVDGGHTGADGAPVVAANGSNIFVVYRSNEGNVLKLARSKDSGASWGGAHTVFTLPADGSYINLASISVSGDPVFPTQKIIHIAYELTNSVDSGIYYTWADATNLDSWSAPVRVSGSIGSTEDPSIATSKSGKVFIKFQSGYELFLTTSDSHEAGVFTEPAIIPVSASLPNTGDDAEIFVDKSNNLHLSYPYCTDTDCTKAGIKYTRLPAGSSVWSTPTTVLAPTTSGNGHSALTAYDANNIYIASVLGNNLTFYGTTNGGTTWTKKVVLAKTATVGAGSRIAITVNSSKAITVGSPVDTNAADGTNLKRESRLFRSTDGGATWSTATTIPNASYISMGLDGNGKVLVVNRPAGALDDGEQACYFSREK